MTVRRILPTGKVWCYVPGMTLISMDALDQRGATLPFQIKNVESAPVHPDQPKTPTPLGFYLLRAMVEVGYDRVAPFARKAGVSGSTMTRYIYGGTGRPESDTLLQIAVTLADAGFRDGPGSGAVQQIHQELLAEAGYRIGAVEPVHTYDPLALELDDLIGEASTLPESDRELLRTMVDRLVAPYRRKGRRRAG